MEKQRIIELLGMVQTAMQEIRPVSHDDLIKFEVTTDECVGIYEIAAGLLKDTEYLRLRESSGNLLVDLILIERYLRKAVSFLRDATEILKPYEEGLSVPSLKMPFLDLICKDINDVDLYNGGLKSYVRLGVLHHVVESHEGEINDRAV